MILVKGELQMHRTVCVCGDVGELISESIFQYEYVLAPRISIQAFEKPYLMRHRPKEINKGDPFAEYY